jgi:FAD/FMN-containing dehydrogenase
MPEADAKTLKRREEIVADMRIIVPGEGVVDTENEMRAFETDGLTAYRQLPLVVVLPETVAQVSRILKYCHERNIRVVPRGSGTSLSGGALPLEDAVLLVMSKFNRILDIDYANRTVVAQPGVTNLGITQAVEHEGFYYAPDPSSQIACSIGGNVAENSGGVHCLKYGLRVANVFHAGDGNLHPLILYDANKPGELEKAEAFGADILRLCVKVGGVLTGEHGVGVEKRDLMPEMFTEEDLNQQIRVKCAFDPNHLLNPGKMFPQLHRCAELGRMHIHRGQMPFPELERF